MKEKPTIPSDDSFGMDSIKDVKYIPNKVKEVEDLGNVVSID